MCISGFDTHGVQVLFSVKNTSSLVVPAAVWIRLWPWSRPLNRTALAISCFYSRDFPSPGLGPEVYLHIYMYKYKYAYKLLSGSYVKYKMPKSTKTIHVAYGHLLGLCCLLQNKYAFYFRNLSIPGSDWALQCPCFGIYTHNTVLARTTNITNTQVCFLFQKFQCLGF